MKPKQVVRGSTYLMILAAVFVVAFALGGWVSVFCTVAVLIFTAIVHGHQFEESVSEIGSWVESLRSSRSSK